MKSRDHYRCLECSELVADVEKVLEAVTQAERLWQQAVKQLDANQLEGMTHLSSVKYFIA